MPRSVLMLSNDIRVKVSHRINYALHSHVNFKDKMDWGTGERECGERKREERGGGRVEAWGRVAGDGGWEDSGKSEGTRWVGGVDVGRCVGWWVGGWREEE